MHADFRLDILTEDEALRICEWRYPPPYDVYNWPAWSRMLQEGREFAEPDVRVSQYCSAVLPGHGLSGYIQLFPIEGVTRLGLGLRPDLCGRGLGTALALQAAKEAVRRRPCCCVDLEVEVWNQRAISCYGKAGFKVEQRYERLSGGVSHDVFCMILENGG